MGRRLHLCADGRRLAICRRSTGPLLPTCRRLVNAVNHVGTIGHGRVADGNFQTWKTASSPAPFRPVEFTQYTSEDLQRLLDSHGITCSMSRRGNCWERQRSSGKRLLDLENRAAELETIPHP